MPLKHLRQCTNYDVHAQYIILIIANYLAATKISAKFQRGHLHWESQIKVAIFDQYILETVQDKDINQSVNQSIYRSNDRSIDRSINQSINRSKRFLKWPSGTATARTTDWLKSVNYIRI